METLEVIIGLIFIFLLLSLLATTIQEIVASLLSMRGRTLLDAVAKLLEIENLDEFASESKRKALKRFKDEIKNSRIYKKYSSRFLGIRQFPSYLTSEQVADIVKEVMQNHKEAEANSRGGVYEEGGATPEKFLNGMKQEELKSCLEEICYGNDANYQAQSRGIFDDLSGSIEEQVEDLKNAVQDNVAEVVEAKVSALKESVQAKIDQAKNTAEEAKDVFQKYYDETMNRATGWYKRNVQRNLIIIGLIVGIAIDADTFKIYSNLNQFPDDRKELLAIANNFIEEDKFDTYTSSIDSSAVDSLTITLANTSSAEVEEVSALKSRMEQILLDEIDNVPPPLGLGRTDGFPAAMPGDKNPGLDWAEIGWRFQKFVGWLVTALAISLGAPFWFDMLKRLIHIRNAGVRPGEKEA